MAANEQHGKAVEQLLALSPTSMRQPTQMSKTQAIHKESSSTAITSFLASLTSHYATLSDSVTPHLFAQLCRNYNTGRYDERAFYVAAYRLFLSTDSTHLMHGFRAFLPLGWREVELSWLDRAIEAEVETERRLARKHIGELADMVDGGSRVPEILTGSAAVPVSDDLDLEATPKPAPAVTKKKKTPTNGFRSSHRPQSNSAATPLRPLAPKPSINSDKKSPPTVSPKSETAPTIGKSPLSTNESSKVSSTPNTPSNQQKTFKRPLPLDLPKPSTDITSQASASTSTPSTPRTTRHYHKHQSPLPSASTIPHVSPIYPTTRAIIARPETRPYIHALCGARFGYPSEVHRHHKGQSGRAGCWEKSGKPAGDDGKWDAHESCKVGLKDLEYVKVQEGWVVVDWRETGDWLKQERGDENVGHGDLSVVDAETNEKAKSVAGPQIEAEIGDETGLKTEHAGDDSDDAGEGEVDDDDYAVPSDEETPKAKRQKTESIKTENASVANADASVRAAALGLRTRK